MVIALAMIEFKSFVVTVSKPIKVLIILKWDLLLLNEIQVR